MPNTERYNWLVARNEMLQRNDSESGSGSYHSWMQSIGKGSAFASSGGPLQTDVTKCLGVSGDQRVSVTRNVPAHHSHLGHLFCRHRRRLEQVHHPSFVTSV